MQWIALEENLYRNNLKNREFDKEASQNSHLEQATIVRATALSEDENFEKKPMPSKTDSSDCFGINPITASHAIKRKRYRCPECAAIVQLRSGPHRQAHFYHL